MPENKSAAVTSPQDTLKTIGGMQAAGPGTAARLYMAWLEGLGDIGSEAMQFVSERIAEDVKTQHEIMHCKNAAEVIAIQRRFLQKALDQYVAEGGKLMKMSSEIVQEAFATSRE